MARPGEPADLDSEEAIVRHLKEAFASGDADRIHAAINEVASAFRALRDRTLPRHAAVAEEAPDAYIAESRF